MNNKTVNIVARLAVSLACLALFVLAQPYPVIAAERNGAGIVEGEGITETESGTGEETFGTEDGGREQGGPEAGNGEEKPAETEAGSSEEESTEPESGSGEEGPTETETGSGEEVPTEPETGSIEEGPTEPEAGSGEEVPTEPEAGSGEEVPTEPEAGSEEEMPAEPETELLAVEAEVLAVGNQDGLPSMNELDQWGIDVSGTSITGVSNPDLLPEILNIPEGIEEIQANAFREQTTIKSIIMPASLKYIGKMAFSNCTGLENVEFGSGIKEVYPHVFSGCSELKYVDMSKADQLEKFLLGVFGGYEPISLEVLKINTHILEGWYSTAFTNTTAANLEIFDTSKAYVGNVTANTYFELGYKYMWEIKKKLGLDLSQIQDVWMKVHITDDILETRRITSQLRSYQAAVSYLDEDHYDAKDKDALWAICFDKASAKDITVSGSVTPGSLGATYIEKYDSFVDYYNFLMRDKEKFYNILNTDAQAKLDGIYGKLVEKLEEEGSLMADSITSDIKIAEQQAATPEGGGLSEAYVQDDGAGNKITVDIKESPVVPEDSQISGGEGFSEGEDNSVSKEAAASGLNLPEGGEVAGEPQPLGAAGITEEPVLPGEGTVTEEPQPLGAVGMTEEPVLPGEGTVTEEPQPLGAAGMTEEPVLPGERTITEEPAPPGAAAINDGTQPEDVTDTEIIRQPADGMEISLEEEALLIEGAEAYQEPDSIVNTPDDLYKWGIKLENLSITGVTESTKLPSRLVIPEGITSINTAAFDSQASLEEVVFPASVRALDVYAFNNCRNIKKITLDNPYGGGIQRLNTYSFYGCDSLEEVILNSERLDYIDSQAFVASEHQILERLTVNNNIILREDAIKGDVFTNIDAKSLTIIDTTNRDIPGDSDKAKCFYVLDEFLPDINKLGIDKNVLRSVSVEIYRDGAMVCSEDLTFELQARVIAAAYLDEDGYLAMTADELRDRCFGESVKKAVLFETTAESGDGVLEYNSFMEFYNDIRPTDSFAFMGSGVQEGMDKIYADLTNKLESQVAE